MSRTAKYILTILVIGALALWLLTVYRSCERKKQLEDTTIISDTGADDTDELDAQTQDTDDLYVDEEDDPNTSDEDTGTNEEDDTDDPGTGEENESGGVFADGEADIDGEYLVVAGAFILKENAEAHIREIERKGIDAERRVFLGSDYHSVIIGNFKTEGDANMVAKKLGTEAYVHKKRYLKQK